MIHSDYSVPIYSRKVDIIIAMHVNIIDGTSSFVEESVEESDVFEGVVGVWISSGIPVLFPAVPEKKEH